MTASLFNCLLRAWRGRFVDTRVEQERRRLDEVEALGLPRPSSLHVYEGIGLGGGAERRVPGEKTP